MHILVGFLPETGTMSVTKEWTDIVIVCLLI